MKILRSIVTYILERLDLYSAIFLKLDSALKEDGWFKSYRERAPVDADGNPLPWITYPAIEFLKRRVKKEMSVFEYGCGGSTLWWSLMAKEVVAVEHDKEWYQKISAVKPPNVSLYQIDLVRDGEYSKKVGDYENKFDIIVIDGRDRINCAKNSLKALKTNGIIIWDNSDRSEYRDGYNFLLKNGFKKIEFVGMCPVVTIKTETAVFYRSNNNLGI